LQDFELLCLDGTRAPIDSAATCNWGSIPAHVVMTSLVRDPALRSQYKTLLLMLSTDFGENGASTDLFQMFESLKYGRQNLMFSDETVMFKDVSQVAGGTRDTYYTWAGELVSTRTGQLVGTRDRAGELVGTWDTYYTWAGELMGTWNTYYTWAGELVGTRDTDCVPEISEFLIWLLMHASINRLK